MTTTDDHGQPLAAATDHQSPPTDAAQTVSLTTQQAAQQLGVDSRTVRRYITDGIHTPGGALLRLEARQVTSRRGQEWQIFQHDLQRFMEERDRQATEGQSPGQAVQVAQEQNQALTASIHLLAAELDRRSQALTDAVATAMQKAAEAGQAKGRNEVLEKELEAARQQIARLEQERNEWQHKAYEAFQAGQQAAQPPPRRIRLLPWQKEKDT